MAIIGNLERLRVESWKKVLEIGPGRSPGIKRLYEQHAPDGRDWMTAINGGMQVDLVDPQAVGRNFALEQVPGATHHVVDVRDFEVKEGYDAVLSLNLASRGGDEFREVLDWTQERLNVPGVMIVEDHLGYSGFGDDVGEWMEKVGFRVETGVVGDSINQAVWDETSFHLRGFKESNEE